MDLFQQNNNSSSEPLASRMRPRNLEEYLGQDHILGPGRLLRRAIQADQLSSLIFYGPPGTGKTTLARVIANSTASRFVSMNAVLSGVKDLREAIEEARQAQDLYDKRSILFVDEVHRWNKSQQDALLPWVEKGTIILIGATTENPYFEVNKALVSRSRVFQLQALTEGNLKGIAQQALGDSERGYGKWRVSVDDQALDHLVKTASGDARSLLNALQLAVETSVDSFPPPAESHIEVDLAAAEESIQQKAVLYDKEGDYHFDTISAFIKSIRGSDPDGALYWMARMIKAGEDPRFIFRRMLISASEDIGLADPQALGIVEAAAATYDRIGMPEGQFPLAQAAIYLATCPKSNSTLAFFDALDAVEQEEAQVPNHLKDSNRDKHSFGHGKGYRYPHAFREHWVAQQYLPGTLKGRIFYQPTGQGYEGTIQEQVIRRREEQLEVMLDESPEELSYSPGDKERNRWIRRLQSNQGSRKALLSRIMELIETRRSHRILMAPLNWTQLFWELYRKIPEGGLFGLYQQEEMANLLGFSMETLPESERPQLIQGLTNDTSWLSPLLDQGIRWEHIVAQGFPDSTEDFPLNLNGALAPQGIITAYQPLPGQGSRFSQILDGKIETSLFHKIKQKEDSFYEEKQKLPRRDFLEDLKDWTILTWQEVKITEVLDAQENWIQAWMNPQEGSWWSIISEDLSELEASQVKAAIQPGRIPRWERCWLIYQLQLAENGNGPRD